VNRHFKTHRSQLYRDFKSIRTEDHRAVVRFFEAHEKAIFQLDFEEFFDLLVAYTEALFEIGSYAKHSLMADVVIEASIEQNVHFHRGADIYFDTLFRKACSLYHMYELNKSAHILRQLIRMKPGRRESVFLLKKVLLRRPRALRKNLRAAAMFLFLLTPLIIVLDELAVKPFYAQHQEMVALSRNAVFATGWLCLLGSEVIHRLKVEMEVRKSVQK
jgi:hypothetical protein